MKIPVFVSCPNALTEQQMRIKEVVVEHLDRLNLSPCTLGVNDYPTQFPLKEVYSLACHCSGGIILGFEQIVVTQGVEKPDTSAENVISPPMSLPAPWNHLEAGILFSLNLPLLIFREKGIKGGIFDEGSSGLFIHKMPTLPLSAIEKDKMSDIFFKWQTAVRNHYYRGLGDHTTVQ